MYPENNASNFRNQLQVPLDFGREMDQWEVGLSELQIPSTFYNVTNSVNTFSIRYKIEPTQSDEPAKRHKKYEDNEERFTRQAKDSRWSTPDTWVMKPATFLDAESFFEAMNDAAHIDRQDAMLHTSIDKMPKKAFVSLSADPQTH